MGKMHRQKHKERREFIESHVTEIKYYFFRDRNGVRRVTVCILVEDAGAVARGVSICSVLDNPNSKVSRKIAFERALHALMTGESGLPINYSNHIQLQRSLVDCSDPHGGAFRECRFQLKSEVHPSLTPFETVIV